ncbi:hypothetical protein [Nocardia asiatica]|uniref:hypothetical protein n=1 Tax=Nocardia asiatica TaxID=209252 RepID=UPI0002F052A0|nr:hypothetical protein [Nocardia asiatica]
MTALPCGLTDYGFVWGPAEVTRLTEIDGRVVVGIRTATGQEITIYVSATGRSIRVFKKGHGELKAVPNVSA